MQIKIKRGGACVSLIIITFARWIYKEHRRNGLYHISTIALNLQSSNLARKFSFHIPLFGFNTTAMESDKAQAQALLMFNCVHQGHFNVLRKLLKAGANPNVFDAEGEPLIFIPVVNGDYETLEVLLESGKYILIQASHKPDPFSLVLFLQEFNRIFCCFYTDI